MSQVAFARVPATTAWNAQLPPSMAEADRFRINFAWARPGVVRGSSFAIRSAQSQPGRPHSDRLKTYRRPVSMSVTLTRAPNLPRVRQAANQSSNETVTITQSSGLAWLFTQSLNPTIILSLLPLAPRPRLPNPSISQPEPANVHLRGPF